MLITAIATSATTLALSLHCTCRMFAVIDTIECSCLTVRTLRYLRASQKLILHLAHVILSILSKLHRYLFEDHVILSQCTCLVREEVLNTAELLRDGRVTSNGSFNFLVCLNCILIEKLGEVQIDSH